MKKIALLLLCNVVYAGCVQGQINVEIKPKSEKIKHIELAPLPSLKINFDEILKKNQERNIDIYDVYAWSKIFESTEESSLDMVLFISKKLTITEMIDANQRYSQLLTDIKDLKYKNKSLYPSKLFFMPNNIEFEIIPIKTIAPEYPRVAAIAKLQGYVNLNFNVYQDGSARDIYISNEHPKRIFAKTAVKTISQYDFDIKWKNKKPKSNSKQATTQRIDFKLKGSPAIVSHEKINEAGRLFDLANKGDINAKHSFTNSYKTLPIQFNNKIIKKKQMTQWLFDLSQKGFSDSQYYLGLAIYGGTGCLLEEQKGFEWMVIAANQGNIEAQHTLYKWINLNQVKNTSGHPASYWLEKSAEKGSLISKLEFAKLTSKLNEGKPNRYKQALVYIEEYTNAYGNLPQSYQIKASLLSKLGRKSKAKAAIKKAIKLAKEAGWNLTELKQQKILIRKYK